MTWCRVGKHWVCVWIALSLVMGKLGLTQATMQQEDLSKHLSLNVHPVSQITWHQCSAELGLLSNTHVTLHYEVMKRVYRKHGFLITILCCPICSSCFGKPFLLWIQPLKSSVSSVFTASAVKCSIWWALALERMGRFVSNKKHFVCTLVFYHMHATWIRFTVFQAYL